MILKLRRIFSPTQQAFSVAQFYWKYAIVCVTGFSLYSFSKRIITNDYRKWLLPYGPLTVLDITHSPNYEITFFYQWICIGSMSAIYGTTDLIIAGVLAHISYQFKVLQNFLRNIVEYSRKEMLKEEGNIFQERTMVKESRNRTIPWKYLEKSIKQAVQYHVAIIDLAKAMEEVFRYMLLTTFLVTMENTGKDIRSIMEYMVGSAPIFILCYWGEEILTECGHVGAAAYDADFVGCDARFQKALEMIIRRSQISTKLTAGKFADICLDTCLWIWRRSYTMCMLMAVNTNIVIALIILTQYIVLNHLLNVNYKRIATTAEAARLYRRFLHQSIYSNI